MTRPSTKNLRQLGNINRKKRRKDRLLGLAMAAVIATGAWLVVQDMTSEVPTRPSELYKQRAANT